MNKQQLKPYMPKIGDRHQSVQVLKQLLNASPQIRCNLQITNEFDIQT